MGAPHIATWSVGNTAMLFLDSWNESKNHQEVCLHSRLGEGEGPSGEEETLSREVPGVRTRLPFLLKAGLTSTRGVLTSGSDDPPWLPVSVMPWSPHSTSR